MKADPSQLVRVTPGHGLARSVEAESVAALAQRLELGVSSDVGGEGLESERLLKLFDTSTIQGTRSSVEQDLAQLSALLSAPIEYSSSTGQKAAEAEQQRLKKERQQRKKAKQAENEAKNNASKLSGARRQTTMSGALALQAKLQADPVAMEKFLKEVDEAKRREQEKHKEQVMKERERYKERMMEAPEDEQLEMPLRFQNIVAANVRSVNKGLLSREATMGRRATNSLRLVKRQNKARDTRERMEVELQNRADEMREQFSIEKQRAVNTPVRKQFELAASLFLTGTIWRCANVCIEEHRARTQRDLEYRTVFVLQRHFREALRILHLRQKNHALIKIRTVLMNKLLLRRYLDKEKATEKIKLLAEDMEMRSKLSSAMTVFYKKILVVQRFAKRLYVVSNAQREVLVSLLFEAEGDIVNEIVCNNLFAKAKIKYEKDLKEWKDLRKVSRSKADKMGPPVLERPGRQSEDVLAPLRVDRENLVNAALVIFKQRIKLKSWDDTVRLFYIKPESATKIMQSIRTAVESGGVPDNTVLAEMSK